MCSVVLGLAYLGLASLSICFFPLQLQVQGVLVGWLAGWLVRFACVVSSLQQLIVWIPVFAVTGDRLPVSIVAVQTQPASLKLIVVY